MTTLADIGTDRTRIGSLRIRGAAGASRAALASAIRAADLRPPGMPPSSLLLVRGLAVRLHADSAWKGLVDAGPQRLERVGRECLSDAYRRASRQAYEELGADAKVLYFADESDWLASLLFDMVQGRADGLWWWRKLLGPSALAAANALASVMRRHASALPAALVRLDRQRRAVRVVRALAPSQAWDVLQAVANVHGLDLSSAASRIAGGLEHSTHRPARDRSAADARDTSVASPDATRRPRDGADDADRAPRSDRRPAPPWQALLPADTVPLDLGAEQACLLGSALVLAGRPESARSAAFGARLLRWRDATSARPAVAPRVHADASRPTAAEPASPQDARPAAVETPAAPAMPVNARGSPAPAGALSHGRARSAPRAATGSAGAADPHAPRVASSPATEAPPHLARPTTDEPATTPPATAPTAADPGETPAPAGQGGHADAPCVDSGRYLASTDIDTDADTRASPDRLSTAASAALVADVVPSPSVHGVVDTQWAGLLFLINLMTALDLPDVFEADRALASRVGAWGVLEALSRALALDDDTAVADPLWRALAGLSRRHRGARLGADLRGGEHRLPLAWRVHAPDEPASQLRWAHRGERLRIWSDAGYIVADVHCNGLAAATLAQGETMARFPRAKLSAGRFGDAPLADLRSPLAAAMSPALRHWLALTLPFIRQRLRRALGTASEAGLFRLPGRLHISPTHIDIVMSQDDVSLPARIAGLDRNPGWLPGFGRVVLFHFE